jgi:cysteine desulfurase
MPAELAQTAVRFSFDASITRQDLDQAAAAVKAAVAGVRNLGAGQGR